MSKVRVAVIDDNEKMCDLLEDVLLMEDDMEVVGKATDGMSGLDLIRNKEPDVVLLDLGARLVVNMIYFLIQAIPLVFLYLYSGQ